MVTLSCKCIVENIPSFSFSLILIKLFLVYSNLSQNQLSGDLPDFLQTAPDDKLKSVDVSSNLFYCPLPSWCDLPPAGNGDCAPCVPNLTPSSTIDNGSSGSGGMGWIIFGVVFVILFGVVAVAALLASGIYFYKKNRRHGYTMLNDEHPIEY